MGASHQDARKGHPYYGRAFVVRGAYARKIRQECYVIRVKGMNTINTRP